MPRKTNGIVYELFPRPTKDEDGKPFLYAEPVITVKHSVKELDAFCAEYRGMSRHSVETAFNLACEVCAMWLKEGHRVETPFGTFAPKLKLLGDHTDPNRVTGKDIVYDGVKFTAAKDFVNDADCSREGFRRDDRFVKPKKAQSQEELEQALRKSISHGYITVKMFMIRSGMKQTSARNYLNSLCKGDSPRLRKYKEGQTMHYRVLDSSLMDKK